MSLLNSLLWSVVNDQIATQISKATGLSEEQTKKAVSMAMPLLMGAVAKNSTSNDWAESLNKALEQHDGSLLDNLDISNILNGDDGQKIIWHILWSKTVQAEQAIAKETGANTDQIANIMKIAGPLLMGALGKAKKTQWLDLGGLTSLLSNEKQAMKSDWSIQSMIFDFIDQNDDGSIIDDLFNFASKMMKNK